MKESITNDMLTCICPLDYEPVLTIRSPQFKTFRHIHSKHGLSVDNKDNINDENISKEEINKKNKPVNTVAVTPASLSSETPLSQSTKRDSSQDAGVLSEEYTPIVFENVETFVQEKKGKSKKRGILKRKKNVTHSSNITEKQMNENFIASFIADIQQDEDYCGLSKSELLQAKSNMIINQDGFYDLKLPYDVESYNKESASKLKFIVTAGLITTIIACCYLLVMLIFF